MPCADSASTSPFIVSAVRWTASMSAKSAAPKPPAARARPKPPTVSTTSLTDARLAHGWWLDETAMPRSSTCALKAAGLFPNRLNGSTPA